MFMFGQKCVWMFSVTLWAAFRFRSNGSYAFSSWTWPGAAGTFVRVLPWLGILCASSVGFSKFSMLDQSGAQVQRLFKEQVSRDEQNHGTVSFWMCSTEVMPALKNVASHKSEGGGERWCWGWWRQFFQSFSGAFPCVFPYFWISVTGLISMLANFRRPTSSVFGLFTQPEVREVVYEVGLLGRLCESGWLPVGLWLCYALLMLAHLTLSEQSVHVWSCQLEPVMWNIFVDLSGDPLAKEVQIAVAELWQLW